MTSCFSFCEGRTACNEPTSDTFKPKPTGALAKAGGFFVRRGRQEGASAASRRTQRVRRLQLVDHLLRCACGWTRLGMISLPCRIMRGIIAGTARSFLAPRIDAKERPAIGAAWAVAVPILDVVGSDLAESARLCRACGNRSSGAEHERSGSDNKLHSS